MKNILAISILLTLSGCSSMPAFVDSEGSPKNVLFENWNDYVSKTFIDGTYAKNYQCSSSNLENANAERNTQLEIFMIGVDTYYDKHKNLLISGRGGLDTLFDLTQLGITAAGTLASGGTTQVLSAIATAMNGTQLSIDKNIFHEQSALVITAKMEQLRLAKLNEIDIKKKLSCNDYSLNAAMRDGIEYYYAGTINTALSSLANEIGKKTIVEEVKRNEITAHNLGDSEKNAPLKKLLIKEAGDK